MAYKCEYGVGSAEEALATLSVFERVNIGRYVGGAGNRPDSRSSR